MYCVVAALEKTACEGPVPKTVLYDQSQLQLSWRPSAKKGCGLQNTHNTCFMNSVLQALTYTPAFNNYLASKHHSLHCKILSVLQSRILYVLISK